MSTCGIKNLRTFNGDNNTGIIGIDGHQENGPGNINLIRDTKGVETIQTPPAPMEVATTALSVDQEMKQCRLDNVKERKDNAKGKKTNGKNSSGSGSGDQDLAHPDDGTDVSAKKRKTRRGKPKHRKLKPYTKQSSYQDRLRTRSIGRLIKKTIQPPAPYNTTQFLMEDHSDLPDLDVKLSKTSNNHDLPVNFQKPPAPTRTRDSSFSIDSDEDYFYSSPEDEEEFLTKEFSSAYEDLHAERLSALSKTELIQEYIQLEAKLDLLTKRMKSKNLQADEIDRNLDIEIAKKQKIYQQKIDDLMKQNEQLRSENEKLRGKGDSSESSVDSESDSVSSSNSDKTDCSCPDDEHNFRRNKEQRIKERQSTDKVGSDGKLSTGNINGNSGIQDNNGLPT